MNKVYIALVLIILQLCLKFLINLNLFSFTYYL